MLALFAGIGLVLAFVGILHLLDLGVVHGRRGRKLGWTLVGLSIVVVIAGAVTLIWHSGRRPRGAPGDGNRHPA